MASLTSFLFSHGLLHAAGTTAGHEGCEAGDPGRVHLRWTRRLGLLRCEPGRRVKPVDDGGAARLSYPSPFISSAPRDPPWTLAPRNMHPVAEMALRLITLRSVS
jgi:hypothetical protein